MRKPEYHELETELKNNKSYLIGRYLIMLDPKANSGKDELDLLDGFVNFFTEHKDKEKNYIEYMIFLRSYILLSHSAIEEFIEETLKYYFDTSTEIYVEQNKINSILKWFILKSDFEKAHAEKEFLDVVKILKDSYFESINKNHGIKKHNLEKMFSRIGIDDLSYELFEKLGEMRGTFAHHNGKSAHVSLKINQPLNPSDCVKLVEDVMMVLKEEILKSLDEAIN